MPNKEASDYTTLDFQQAFQLSNDTQIVISSSVKDAFPHVHNFLELMYVAHGTIAHSVNFTNPIIMKTGDFTLIDTDSVHEYTSMSGKCEVINIGFTGSFIDKRLSQKAKLSDVFHSSKLGLKNKYAIAPSGIVLHDTNKNIIDTIDLMNKELINAESLSTNVLRHLLDALLISIAKIPRLSENSNSLSELSAKLINYIELHYAEQNLLNRVAAELHYSTAYLSNKFRHEAGMTFNNYLQNYRIDIAKNLLNTTSMDISSVSVSVGYTDCKFFTEIFKKHTGITPRQYKKNINKYIYNSAHL